VGKVFRVGFAAASASVLAFAIAADPGRSMEDWTGGVRDARSPTEYRASVRNLTDLPTAREHAATISAMAPTKRRRPRIAILGQNKGAETTDFLIPYGVLKRSGVADVFALSMYAGPLKLMPALTIAAESTVTEFDHRFPDGADYVIVPALHNVRDPHVLAWLKAQASKGAVIVGICSGVQTVAAAGLLKGRRATGHWYDIQSLKKNYPEVRWTQNRRYIADTGVVTTSGISASIPVSLALVEAIAGRLQAERMAHELGVDGWGEGHDGTRFRFAADVKWKIAGNLLAFWNWETFGIPIETGVDEISLALNADAWSRTYRSKAVTVAVKRGTVRSRGGIQIVPDQLAAKSKAVPLPRPRGAPGTAVPAALSDIEARYGRKTALFVAAQQEYPWGAFE
jgi:transcriptional regulator GlxA family with amidase domain